MTRHISFLLVAFIIFTTVFAQKSLVKSEFLTLKKTAALFPDTVRKTLGIIFPISRAYKYADKSGQYYCVLTESRNKITEDRDTTNRNIKAINCKVDKGSLTKIWEINDNLIKNNNDETSIWFWTKYLNFKDYDGDDLADPVIIYGTSAANGYDDGRIKILIYYKGKKIAIRHQNGILDSERETQGEKAFYDLPQTLQASIKQKMELMVKNDQAIFPAGWQAAMKNKKTTFSEQR